MCGVPGSLLDSRRLTSLIIILAGALSVLEISLLAGGDWWMAILVFFPPVIGWAFIASELSVGRRLHALAIAAATLIGHALIGLVTLGCVGVISEEGVIIGGILETLVFVMVAVVSAPVTLAGTVLGRAAELDAGDAMLGYCGGWLAMLQAFMFLAFASTADRAPTVILLIVLGVLLGASALCVCIARAIGRRRWCARVMRGEIPGWRLRRPSTPAELANLPCVFKSSDGIMTVLERVEMGGAIYRGGLVGQAVAAVPVPHRLHAQASNALNEAT
jgi:hypothetical protein